MPKIKAASVAEHVAEQEQAVFAAIGTVVPGLDPATRAELAASHDAMLRPLLATLHEAGIQTADEQRIVANMIQQLVLTTARADSSPAAPGRRYLLRAIRGLLGLPSSP